MNQIGRESEVAVSALNIAGSYGSIGQEDSALVYLYW